jgi:hypothetical protein
VCHFTTYNYRNFAAWSFRLCMKSAAETSPNEEDSHNCAASIYAAVHAVQKALPHALHRQLDISTLCIHTGLTAAANLAQDIHMLLCCS